MISILMLEDDDIILSEDFFRPLYIISEDCGRSDYFTFESNGVPHNHSQWVQVQRGCPFWIGKTVGEYNKKMKNHNKWEFVRGSIPESHIRLLTEHEWVNQKDDLIFKVGKYKGQSIKDVMANNYEYYHWAVNNGVIKSLGHLYQQYLNNAVE